MRYVPVVAADKHCPPSQSDISARPVMATAATNTASDFTQWLHAMKMVARLPGGMPPEFRRKLWLALAEQHLQSKSIDWSKEETKCMCEEHGEDDEELGIQIVKDLHRTGSSLCSGPAGSVNQGKLKRVLLGYARWNPEVGYCQGFNMLGALILQVMDKDDVESLKVMIFLVEGILPTGYFSGSLGGLQADMAVFREILGGRLPKLAKHLQRLQGPIGEGILEPPLTNVFTMQWFLTLFCTCLPINCVLRVWDLVLIEGSDILLRTALAIWGLLEERILATKSADDFYCKMGLLSGELLNGHLFDSNGLIQKVVDLGPIPELQKMRDKHLYNVTPWKDKRGLRFFFSDEEGDSDDDARLEVSTAWGLRLGRRGSFGMPAASRPASDGRERIALDISTLKRQYEKLRERQRQAHIILTSTSRPNVEVTPPVPSLPVNQYLLGRNAIVSSKGRRIGPPAGAIPPSRKVQGVKTTSKSSAKPQKKSEPKDPIASVAKLTADESSSSDAKVRDSVDSEPTLFPLKKSSSVASTASSTSEVSANSASMRSRKKSESSSYSEDSDGNSSTSTSLCDEDNFDGSVSSVEVSPLRKPVNADDSEVLEMLKTSKLDECISTLNKLNLSENCEILTCVREESREATSEKQELRLREELACDREERLEVICEETSDMSVGSEGSIVASTSLADGVSGETGKEHYAQKKELEVKELDISKDVVEKIDIVKDLTVTSMNIIETESLIGHDLKISEFSENVSESQTTLQTVEQEPTKCYSDESVGIECIKLDHIPTDISSVEENENTSVVSGEKDITIPTMHCEPRSVEYTSEDQDVTLCKKQPAINESEMHLTFKGDSITSEPDLILKYEASADLIPIQRSDEYVPKDTECKSSADLHPILTSDGYVSKGTECLSATTPIVNDPTEDTCNLLLTEPQPVDAGNRDEPLELSNQTKPIDTISEIDSYASASTLIEIDPMKTEKVENLLLEHILDPIDGDTTSIDDVLIEHFKSLKSDPAQKQDSNRYDFDSIEDIRRKYYASTHISSEETVVEAIETSANASVDDNSDQATPSLQPDVSTNTPKSIDKPIKVVPPLEIPVPPLSSDTQPLDTFTKPPNIEKEPTHSLTVSKPTVRSVLSNDSMRLPLKASQSPTAITSTSQLSPIVDFSKYMRTSSISPLRTPASSYIHYTQPIMSETATTTADSTVVDPKEIQFKVNDEGVTNEYFERVTVPERPCRLELRSSTSDDATGTVFVNDDLTRNIHVNAFVGDSPVLNSAHKSGDDVFEESFNFRPYATISDYSFMKEKSISLDEPSVNREEFKPTSCPENVTVDGYGQFRKSERVSKIIEENSMILHRLLRRNMCFDEDQAAVENDEQTNCEHKPMDPVYRNVGDTTDNEISWRDQKSIENKTTKEVVTSPTPVQTVSYEDDVSGTISSIKNTIKSIDNVVSLTENISINPVVLTENEGSVSFEVSHTDLDSLVHIQPESLQSNTSIRFDATSEDISETISSIKNTIKSIDSLCKREDRDQRSRDKTIDIIESINEQRFRKIDSTNYEIDLDTTTSEQCVGAISRRSSRDIRREISPRRGARDSERQEYESLFKRDTTMSRSTSVLPSNSCESDLDHLSRLSDQLDAQTVNESTTFSRNSFPPKYFTYTEPARSYDATVPTVNVSLLTYDRHDMSSSSPAPSQTSTYAPEKRGIRHTTVTSTFYDRIKAQQKERTVRFDRSPTAKPSSTVTITKEYLNSLRLDPSDPDARHLKSAESSPSRYLRKNDHSGSLSAFVVPPFRRDLTYKSSFKSCDNIPHKVSATSGHADSPYKIP